MTSLSYKILFFIFSDNRSENAKKKLEASLSLSFSSIFKLKPEFDELDGMY
jgi:hypothetical protein